MITEQAIKILELRGLESEMLVRHGVSSYEKDGSEWLKIPYIMGGEAINHKYRTISGEKRFHQDSDARKCFWNIDILKDDTLKNEKLIICEGELDALSAIQCGFLRVLSVPDGAPAQVNAGDIKYSYVPDIIDLIRDEKEIILAVDNDQAGTNLLHDLSHRLGRQRCKFLKYPKNCKDLNDVLVKYGHKGVIETINRARWIRVDGVYRMSELPPAPESKTFSTGFPCLDKHYKIRPGDFTVVTGIPGHGKSTWVNDLCCRMAKTHGWITAFASFEQHPLIDHVRNFRRWHIGNDPAYWKPEEIQVADEWIEKHFCFLMPAEDDDVTLEWVLERASAAVIQHGANIVVIDPWNEMDHDRPRGMSLTEYTGFAIKQFRKFARKHSIHLILVAHPSKAIKRDGEKPRMPDLYDISDSAHWNNKADVGIIIHRDGEKTIIRIAKTRYHDIIGKPGQVEAIFNPFLNKFEITEGT